MTTRKKKTERKGPAKAKKLALNKETLKDLTANKTANNVRGGARGGPVKCTYNNTGCASAGCEGGE